VSFDNARFPAFLHASPIRVISPAVNDCRDAGMIGVQAGGSGLVDDVGIRVDFWGLGAHDTG